MSAGVFYFEPPCRKSHKPFQLTRKSSTLKCHHFGSCDIDGHVAVRLTIMVHTYMHIRLLTKLTGAT